MSKYTAVAYFGGIPPNNTNTEKPLILTNFCQGVTAAGDTAILHKGMDAIPCDVALIQGFVHEHGKDSPHLRLRRAAIDLQRRNNKRSLIVDSNLFLYANKENPLHYLRYSFDGVFPTTGFYFDTEIDPSRWQKISKHLNLSLKDYRSHGEHILICLQRNGGWSMAGLDVQDWAINTVNILRQYTDRPIVIRAHPGDKAAREYLDPKSPKCKIKFSKAVRLSTNTNLVDDLRNCWAAVNYNSSPVVGAAIEGIPIFVMDSINSQCAEIANTDLSKIETPTMLDRQSWVERLGMFHWNFQELTSGECWQHIRKFIK
jgi:hypothetical protein